MSLGHYSSIKDLDQKSSSSFYNERGVSQIGSSYDATRDQHFIGDMLPGPGSASITVSKVVASTMGVTTSSGPVKTDCCGHNYPAVVEAMPDCQQKVLQRDLFRRICSVLLNPCLNDWNLTALFVEFLGTLILALFSAVPAVEVSNTLTISICRGLILFAMVCMFAPESGAHFNPAVTLGYILTSKISIPGGLLYMLVQLAASFLGGLVAWIFLPAASGLGTPVLALTQGIGLLPKWLLLPFSF